MDPNYAWPHVPNSNAPLGSFENPYPQANSNAPPSGSLGNLFPPSNPDTAEGPLENPYTQPSQSSYCIPNPNAPLGSLENPYPSGSGPQVVFQQPVTESVQPETGNGRWVWMPSSPSPSLSFIHTLPSLPDQYTPGSSFVDVSPVADGVQVQPTSFNSGPANTQGYVQLNDEPPERVTGTQPQSYSYYPPPDRPSPPEAPPPRLWPRSPYSNSPSSRGSPAATSNPRRPNRNRQRHRVGFVDLPPATNQQPQDSFDPFLNTGHQDPLADAPVWERCQRVLWGGQSSGGDVEEEEGRG
ncbi:hypothetical protein MMC24_003582 [Lignoscripta atroalba]|nr:hypothetical protein [Lignoscripta atroalba]